MATDNKTSEVTPVAPGLAATSSILDDPKAVLQGRSNDYQGIDLTQVQPGADASYEAKISILNQALIDNGMGPFQWKIFATTGFGWFIDNVSLSYLLIRCKASAHIFSNSSYGCKP